MLADYSSPSSYFTQPRSAPEAMYEEVPSDRPSLFLTLQSNSRSSHISPLMTEQLQVGSSKKDSILIAPARRLFSSLSYWYPPMMKIDLVKPPILISIPIRFPLKCSSFIRTCDTELLCRSCSTTMGMLSSLWILIQRFRSSFKVRGAYYYYGRGIYVRYNIFFSFIFLRIASFLLLSNQSINIGSGNWKQAVLQVGIMIGKLIIRDSRVVQIHRHEILVS